MEDRKDRPYDPLFFRLKRLLIFCYVHLSEELHLALPPHILQPLFKGRGSNVLQKSVEMVVGIPGIIKIEF